MSIKVDLRIFLFGILFFLTKQIEIYAILMFFALLHELGHLCAGLALGIKPKNIRVNPFGFSISFKTNMNDYNKKIKCGNELSLKRIVIALAGPIVNILIVLICLCFNYKLIIPKENIIYSNLLLAIFNLLPIYPLDGGRILKEFIYIYKGKKEAYKSINKISKMTIVLLTVAFSILILYIHNIALIFVLAYLWYLVIKSEKEYNLYIRAYETIKNI